MKKIIGHLVAAAAIVLVPAAVVFSAPPWAIPETNLWILLGLSGAYVLAVLAGSLASKFRFTPMVPEIAVAASVVAAVLFLLLVTGRDFSRLALLTGTALVVFSLVFYLAVLIFRRHFYLLFGAFLASVVLVIAGGTVLKSEAGIDRQYRSSATISTNQRVLSATHFNGYFPDQGETEVLGGAIARDPGRDSGYLLVRARGDIYRVDWPANDLEITNLGLQVPINREDFESDTDESVPKSAFRVADLLAVQRGEITDLYVSHHYWKTDNDCFVVRVSATEISASSTGRGGADGENWRTLFESSPCLPIKAARGTSFAGEQIGGNLELYDAERILLTVGDHQFDGWYREPNLVQDETASYGKSLLIDIGTGEATIFTLGHRNPQGLTIDASGRIWSTEHGPQGGDELNLLRRGENFGYPYVTYGVEYGSTTWPPSDAESAADALLPVHAWVPSIGISDIVSLDDPAFANWRGDLLIASLAGQAMWRVRLDADRVVYTEPLDLGQRLRDIVTGPNGEIVLWTDQESIIRLRPVEELNEGSALFAVRCGGCHDDAKHRIGPTLRGLFSRSMGSADGYEYSGALGRTGAEWTNERLDAFLSDPSDFAPGTTMAIEGVTDTEERSRIIDYVRYFYR